MPVSDVPVKPSWFDVSLDPKRTGDLVLYRDALDFSWIGGPFFACAFSPHAPGRAFRACALLNIKHYFPLTRLPANSNTVNPR